MGDFLPRHGRSAKPGILVVEDEPIARMAIADHLQDIGFKVYEASSGEEAIHFLSCGEADILVLFTDIRLGPGPDGLEVAAFARAHTPGVRIVLTSSSTAAMTQAKLRGEAALVFPKPYDYEALGAAFLELVQSD
ncbi:MAG: response regulator [Alphaproteobacteria bacterium]|nr:response regulator [Alphaproteobacteria bacterium]